jgi:hypothetical protein
MSFGGINGAGPQGAPIFGNQGPASAPVAAGAVPGQAGAPANGATPFFSASAESVLAAMSRGEVPANLGVSAPQLGGQVPLLQAIAQGIPQNGTNGIGVSSGPVFGGGGVEPNGTTFGGTQAVDDKQMASVPSPTNQYSGN